MKFKFLLVLVIIATGCKEKKKPRDPENEFMPVLAFIRDQVAKVDTSMYEIYQVTIRDTISSDTIYIPREKFRDVAKDFLDIPDIANDEYSDRYLQSKQFDQTINRVLFTYTPTNPEKEEIQREEVLITQTGDQVTSIIIDLVRNTKDSTITKKMLWQMDKSFQVTTYRQLPGKPETISTLRVLWNGSEGE